MKLKKITAVGIMFLFLLPLFLVFADVVSAQPTGIQNKIIRPDGDSLAQWTTVVGGDMVATSTILRPNSDVVTEFTTIYPSATQGINVTASARRFKDASETTAYISGNNVWTYDRLEFYKVDASSIPDGSTLTKMSIKVYRTYSTATGNLCINKSQPFGGTGTYNGIWDEAQLKALTPAGSLAYSLAYSTAPPNWKWYNGSATTWQTQFNTNKTLYIALTGWGFASTDSSVAWNMTTATFGISYTPVPYGSTHYERIDETTAGGNGGTDYIRAESVAPNPVFDRWGMTDLSGSIVVGSIDVTLWGIGQDTGTAIRFGFTDGSTSYYYDPGWTWGSYSNFSYKWTINPYTSAEWTVAEVNALTPYCQNGVSPNPDAVIITQVGLFVEYTVFYGHWSAVDETTSGSDGDTSYVATATIGTYDRFTLSNVPLGATGVVKSINSVNLWVIGRNGGGGNNDIRAGFYIGSTYYIQLQTPVGISYTNFSTGALTTNPATSVAWTLSDVQNLIVYIYGNQNKEMRYTQIGVIISVNYGWIPTFTSTPPTAPHTGYWWPGDAYSYTVTLNESASITNSAKASWMTYTAGNTTLWGRVPATQATGSSSVVIYADSTAGLQRTWQNQTLNYLNTAPTFTSSAITTSSWNIDYHYDSNATDPQGQTITYGLDTDFIGATIDQRGWVNKTKPHTNGTYYIHISAFDGLFTTWQNFTLTVSNLAPYFTSTPIYSVTETFPYSYTVAGTDPEGVGLTYDCTEKPAFLTWTVGNLTLWGRPAVDTYLGGHSVKLTVYDANKYGYQNYTLTVNSVWSATFTSSPVTTGETGDAYYYDANTNETCTFGITQQAVGGTLSIVPATGVITGTFSNSYAGNKWVNVSAQNDRGKYAYQNYTILITDDEAPIADAGTDQTDVPVQQIMYFDGSASTDNVGVVNWTWMFTDGTPQTVYGVSASYIWTSLGSHTVTLTVKDAQGLSDTDTVYINTTRSYILRPIADESVTATWTLSSGSNHWSLLDDPETNGDGNTTYVDSGSAYCDMTLEMGNFSPMAGEEYWIQLWYVGYGTGYAILKNGSTTLGTIDDFRNGNNTLNLTQYQSRAWTAADLNNLSVRLWHVYGNPAMRITQVAIMVWFEVDLQAPIADIQYRIGSGTWVEAPSTFAVNYPDDYEYVSMAFRTTGSFIPNYTNWVNYTWTVRYESNLTLIYTAYGTSFSYSFTIDDYIITLNFTVSKCWGVEESDEADIDPLEVKTHAFNAGQFIIGNIMGFIGAGAFIGMILVPPMAIWWYRKGEGEGISTFRNALLIFVVCFGLFMASLVF